MWQELELAESRRGERDLHGELPVQHPEAHPGGANYLQAGSRHVGEVSEAPRRLLEEAQQESDLAEPQRCERDLHGKLAVQHPKIDQGWSHQPQASEDALKGTCPSES